MAVKKRYRVRREKGEAWDVKATSRDKALKQILGKAQVKVLQEDGNETRYAWPVGPEGKRWIERYIVSDIDL